MSNRSRSDRLFHWLAPPISIVFTLALLETGLRVAMPNLDWTENMPWRGAPSAWSSADEELGFVRDPFITWEGWPYTDPAAHYVEYRTDHNGFRNPPGISEAEVVFVGDSFTEAGNVPEEDTFVRLFEALSGRSAVNLGRAMYGPQQEFIVMQRYVEQYQPKEIVWVLFEGNDLFDSRRYIEHRLERPALRDDDSDEDRSVWTAFAMQFNLTKVAVQAYQKQTARESWEGKVRAFFKTGETEEPVDFLYTYRPEIPEVLQPAWEDIARAIVDAKAWCDERHIALTILFIPTKLRVLGPYSRFATEEDRKKLIPLGTLQGEHDFMNQVEALCSTQDIPFYTPLAALDALAAKGILPYSARFDTHLDILGHKIVAELLAEALAAL